MHVMTPAREHWYRIAKRTICSSLDGFIRIRSSECSTLRLTLTRKHSCKGGLPNTSAPCIQQTKERMSTSIYVFRTRLLTASPNARRQAIINILGLKKMTCTKNAVT